MMARKQVLKPELINLDRCYAESDRQRGITRRTQALLAAAGMSGPEARWAVLIVAAGQDKAVDKALTEARICHWMPVCKVFPKRRAGRKGKPRETVERLAFQGYMLVNLVWTAEGAQGLKSVDGVVDVLGGWERPRPLSETDVLKAKTFLERDPEAIEKLTKAFTKGEMVRINDGPLAHHNAIVTETLDQGMMVLVEIMLFGRPVPVRLEVAQIDKG
jgi:transcription termination/antitermination protein NusG